MFSTRWAQKTSALWACFADGNVARCGPLFCALKTPWQRQDNGRERRENRGYCTPPLRRAVDLALGSAPSWGSDDVAWGALPPGDDK
jgi:hypothetical protein